MSEHQGKALGCSRLLCCLALLLGAHARAEQPLVTVLRPDLPAPTQVFSVEQSADGLLYVGSSTDVLRHDGNRWTRIPLSRPGLVRQLRRDADGRIWVGGYDCFGYLERQPDGRDRFVDLAPAFDPDAAFSDIWQLQLHGDAVYFVALHDAFEVRRDGRTGRRWHHPGRFGALSTLDGELLLQWRGLGLMRLRGAGFEMLPGGEQLAEPMLYNALPLGPGRLLLHDLTPRLALWQNGEITELTALSRSEDMQHLASAIVLDTNEVAFAGDDGMLRVLDLQRQRFRALPIAESFLVHPLRGRDGALLLAVNDGVVRLPWPPTWSLFGSDSGVRGTVHGLHLRDGLLYALSGAGVYEAELRETRPRPPFRRRDWANNEVWAAVDDGAAMLLADSHTLLRVEHGRSVRAGPDDLYPRVLLLDASAAGDAPDASAARLWIGGEHGMTLLARAGGAWAPLAAARELGQRANSLARDAVDGVYVGTNRHGLLHARLVPGEQRLQVSPVVIDVPQAEPHGDWATVARAGEALLVATGAGTFRQEGTRFVADDLGGFGQVRADGDEVFLQLAADGTLWALGQQAVYWRDTAGTWRAHPLDRLGGGGAIDALLPLGDGVALLGGSGRVLRFDAEAAARAVVPATLQLAAVRLERPGVAARWLALDGGANLPAGPGTLVFELAIGDPGSLQPARFQVRLRGLDDRWGEWSEQSSFSYAALPPGDYAFEARAQRATAGSVAAAPFRFTVVPLWYQRTPLQAAAALLLIVAIVALAGVQQRRRLARLDARNRQLDALVHARTHELEDANSRLRELADRDGLTGVGNRRWFDAAIERACADARLWRTPLSLLLVDADHFKRYNDERGHLAGDELLKRLAGCLLAGVRDDTLVARYGGEEFALLARGLDESHAGRFAERLRARVAATLDGMTISIGVASFDPDRDRAPDALIERADAALYRAKRAGRNRVESQSVVEASS